MKITPYKMQKYNLKVAHETLINTGLCTITVIVLLLVAESVNIFDKQF